jgi:hypothetical protein
MTYYYFPFFCGSPAPAIEHGQAGKIIRLVMRCFVTFVMLANQHGENRR